MMPFGIKDKEIEAGQQGYCDADFCGSLTVGLYQRQSDYIKILEWLPRHPHSIDYAQFRGRHVDGYKENQDTVHSSCKRLQTYNY